MGLFSKQERTPAQTVVEDVLKVKKNETALIIANPETNVIAQDLFTALRDVGAKPVLMFQQTKTSSDYAEPSVVGAIKSEPDVILSISAQKLGRDAEGIAHPYEHEGVTYDNAFDLLLDGKKCTRAVWTPGLTDDMFERTVMIDYKQLSERCKKLCAKYENVVSVHVTSPNGTDVVVPVQGRKAMTDDGDFSTPGSGGNIPAGEVFISPLVGGGNTIALETSKKVSSVKASFTEAMDMLKNAGSKALKAEKSEKAEKGEKADRTEKSEAAEEKAPAQKELSSLAEEKAAAQADAPLQAEATENSTQENSAEKILGTNGVIVFDGSMTFSDGDSLLETPITVKVTDGFVSEVTGGEEAKRLLKDITAAERESVALETGGKLPEGMGAVYARNARNIGELGIGLNPSCNIMGNMLEDEKAFRTCHFAIGQNYDGDAPALIHFDGVVRNPTIVFTYADGSTFTALEQGELKI